MNRPVLELSAPMRWLVLASASLGLLFDGIELGLMPVASLSVSQSLLAEGYTKGLGAEWFAWFTASLMLGAAIGGIALGNLGDRIGRTKAMGISILFYSVFAFLGAWAKTQEQMLLLRFLVGLGVGPTPEESLPPKKKQGNTETQRPQSEMLWFSLGPQVRLGRIARWPSPLG